MNNQAAQTMPSLVDEALTYFAKAGDEGDRRYVEAIRQHIAALSQPAGVADGWRKLAMAELTRWMCARDAETAYERLTTALAAAPAASGGEDDRSGWCRGDGCAHKKFGEPTWKEGDNPFQSAPQPPSGASVSEYTTGHCSAARQPGGCPHHNLQCGWPECDRRPVEHALSSPRQEGDSTAASTKGVTEDAIERKARELFDAQADALAAPWDVQWDRTKQYWRKVSRESLLTSPTTGADGGGE